MTTRPEHRICIRVRRDGRPAHHLVVRRPGRRPDWLDTLVLPSEMGTNPRKEFNSPPTTEELEPSPEDDLLVANDTRPRSCPRRR